MKASSFCWYYSCGCFVVAGIWLFLSHNLAVFAVIGAAVMALLAILFELREGRR
jgi:Flp pilus assembly protein TadB